MPAAPAYRIERLGICHSELAARLHVAAMADGTGDQAWSATALAQLLSMPGIAGFLAVIGTEQPAGFALMRTVADEAELLTIAVDPPLQRRGVGLLLVERVVAHARASGATRLFLEVAPDNQPARALYRKLGFAQVGERAAYYARPGRAAMDSLVLALALEEA